MKFNFQQYSDIKDGEFDGVALLSTLEVDI